MSERSTPAETSPAKLLAGPGRRADAAGRARGVDRVDALTSASRGGEHARAVSRRARTSTSASGAPMTSSATRRARDAERPGDLAAGESGQPALRCGVEPASRSARAAMTLGRKGTGASTRPSSSQRIESSICPSPCPPWDSAMAIPGHPSSESSCQSSPSLRPAWACSRTRSGVERSESMSRAVRWMSR